MSSSRRLFEPYLLSHWSLNGQAKDAVSKFNGTWVGTEKYAEGPSRHEVGDFNGASYVDLTTHLAAYASLTATTLAAWIKLDSVGADVVALAASDQGDASSELKLGVTSTNKAVIGAREAGASTAAVGGTSLAAGSWCHVCGVVSAAASYVYLNGKLDGSGTGFAAFSAVTGLDFMSIGVNKDSGGLQWYFPGDLRDVMVFNVDLTGDEVAKLTRLTRIH